MSDKKKLGAGIITMSVIFLVLAVFTILGTAINLVAGDSINQILIDSGQVEASMLPTTTDYIISLVVSIFTVIFIILILCKNKIGVLGYFALNILSHVYNLIITQITVSTIISQLVGILIIALYGFFIYKKRDVYGFTKEVIEETC